jgi:hypothetical protein
MQFETKHNITEKVVLVTFSNYTKVKPAAWEQLNKMFKYMGANQCNDNSFLFPNYLNSGIISELIKNTCFVCGGLMKDSTAMLQGKCHVDSYDNAIDTYQGTIEYPDNNSTKQIKIRKCSSCGHSHT